jgi:hypothetical protein
MATSKKHPVASRFTGALEPGHFDLLARDPQSWLECGVDLLRAARAVIPAIWTCDLVRARSEQEGALSIGDLGC